MKNRYFLLIASAICLFTTIEKAAAQCPGGYTQSQLNWDWLDFLPSTGAIYTDWYDSPLPSTRAYSQTFSMGTRRVQFTMASTSNFTLNGENATNTAHPGSFATAGDDVQFTTTTNSNRTITITFDTEVTNVKFSLFDLDNSQRVTIAATNAASVSVPALLTTANVSSGIVIVGQQATGPGSGYNNNNNNGTLNVQILGPVQTITLTLSNAGGDIWLSDIDACVTGNFPSNWRNVSRPFTGMPAYILTVVNNRFLLVDPATGKAKDLFTDPSHTNMNGMGYDPVNRILYYTHSLTGSPSNTRTIYKYNVDAETIGVFINDVRSAPLNIPIYEPGVTSGSASFYNGSLYFGVEASNSARTSGRENTVWKIDMDASQNPLRASQVYASRVDSNISGNNRLIHDWADIGVTNGIIYDFDGAGTGTANLDTMYYHFNMMSGQRVQFAPNGPGNIGPKQVAIDWQENVYNMGSIPVSSAGASTAVGFIAPYNYNGTIDQANTRLVYTMPGTVYITGSWGDCSEAFRPTCDFGDAPATYDPDIWSPAVHERDNDIRIGATWDREWLKRGVTGIEDIDDGLAYAPIMAPGGGGYVTQVSVYNNKGVNANLIAWLDYNGNGVFDASEAITPITVPSSASSQNFWLYWPVTTNTFINGQHTYLRIRITTGAMTAANPTGYYEDGETEDYRIPVDNFPLSANLLSFNASVINNDNVELSWKTSGEENLAGFELQRSSDNNNWTTLEMVSAKGNGTTGTTIYSYNDLHPLAGTSFYRLRLFSADGKYKFSDIRTVSIQKSFYEVNAFPNPATEKITVKINTVQRLTATVSLVDISGRIVYSKPQTLNRGLNMFEVPLSSVSGNGVYVLQIQSNEDFYKQRIVVIKR
ncbi:MAG: T9SS type A sorting domain-containing protein [Chitinophagaceae bacterium]|nr:T9SS type A sorting domain-containing protein [Chitinophagaceae bacterium]